MLPTESHTLNERAPRGAHVPAALVAASAVLVAAGLPAVWGHLTSPSPASVLGLLTAAQTFSSGVAVGAFVLAATPMLFGHRRLRPLGALSQLVAATGLAAAAVFALLGIAATVAPAGGAARGAPGAERTWAVGLFVLFAFAVATSLRRAARAGAAAHAPTGVDQVLAAVGMSSGFALASGATALLHASTAARGTLALFPFGLMLSSLATGAAAVLAAAVLHGAGGAGLRDALLVLGRLVRHGLVAAAVVCLVEVGAVAATGVPGLFGRGGASWWMLGVPLALSGLSAALLLVAGARRALGLTAVATLAAVGGGLALHLVAALPLGGPADPVALPTAGLRGWSLVGFGAGLAGLLFLLGLRALPVLGEGASDDAGDAPATR